MARTGDDGSLEPPQKQRIVGTPDWRVRCGRRYTAADRRRAKRLREAGHPVAAIARAIGADVKTVVEWFQRFEAEARLRGTPVRLLPVRPDRRFDRARILKDLNATRVDGKKVYSRQQLSKKYGCSERFLSKLARGKLAL